MHDTSSDQTLAGIDAVLEFLLCRTPDNWVSRAVVEIPLLLLDHASLELKAAQQAQTLIRRYGANFDLLTKMSQLAREELRHFEQVSVILENRGIRYRPVSASRYAAALHTHVSKAEPDRLVDTLIVGAIIEARSCERFYSLGLKLGSSEPDVTKLYASLLKSEARHFLNYLDLVKTVAGDPMVSRTRFFLEQEQELILGPDSEIRLHSGIPA